MSATTFMLSLAKFCQSAPKKKNAILGSPISRLARLRFEPLGFASVGTGFQPLKVKRQP